MDVNETLINNKGDVNEESYHLLWKKSMEIDSLNIKGLKKNNFSSIFNQPGSRPFFF